MGGEPALIAGINLGPDADSGVHVLLLRAEARPNLGVDLSYPAQEANAAVVDTF